MGAQGSQDSMQGANTGNMELQEVDKSDTPEQEIMAKDIQNICSYTRWEGPGAWRTNMAKSQLGQLT
eukprot:16450300-Heterocapsa_arctica.AAC.1